MSGLRDSVLTMFPAADVTSWVNTISAVVAAVAALGAVWIARTTVLEAITARRESRDAHFEEMNELRAEREAAAERHRAEMLERDASFVADLQLRRVVQLEVISGLLLHLVEVAREEYFHPPAPVDVTEQGLGEMVTTTRIPAIRLRLDAAVAAFNKMGGTSGDVKLPEPGRGEKASSLRALGDGVSALHVVKDLVLRERAPDTRTADQH